MNALIVTYGLKPGVDRAAFEAWLREVDVPGYARLSSLRNPVYYRAEGRLGEPGDPPFRYAVVIEMTSAADAEAELAKPEWGAFVAEFEARTADPQFVTATRLSL